MPPGWSSRQPPPYVPGGARPPGGRPGAFGPTPPRSPYVPPEPKPGVIPLRPIGLGEILDGAISYIRHSPRATLGLAAIVTSTSAGLQLVAQYILLGDVADISQTGSAEVQLELLVDALSGSIVVAAIGSVITAVAQLVLTGMLTVVVGRAVLGRPAGIGDAWRDVRPRILPLLGLAATLTLLFFTIVAAVAGPVAVLAVAGVPVAVTVAVGVLLGVAAVVTMVWLYVGFALATPALILEHAGVFGSLRRSWTLVRRSFWRVLGILLLTAVIASFIGNLLQAPFLIGQFALTLVNPDLNSWTFRLGLVVGALGVAVAGTLVAPFSAGVRALLYVDRRMRQEGLDIALHGAARDPGDDGRDTRSPWLMSIGGAREEG